MRSLNKFVFARDFFPGIFQGEKYCIPTRLNQVFVIFKSPGFSKYYHAGDFRRL
jgi:hypothetical protein